MCKWVLESNKSAPEIKNSFMFKTENSSLLGYY